VIVAWHEVPGKGSPRKGPSRRVRCDGISQVQEKVHETRTTSGTSCVRSYRTLRDGALEGAFPGTSCQATIGLSLRDRMCLAAIRILLVGSSWSFVMGSRLG
jgi:hypothetical protein